MATYVAFLRAINLGAKRKFPKDDIVAATQAAGFEDVATHINTGNVRLSTRMRSRGRIEQALEEAYLADRGFEVPTIVYAGSELREVHAHASAVDHDGRHYVALLRDEPTAEGEDAAGGADRGRRSRAAPARQRRRRPRDQADQPAGREVPRHHLDLAQPDGGRRPGREVVLRRAQAQAGAGAGSACGARAKRRTSGESRTSPHTTT